MHRMVLSLEVVSVEDLVASNCVLQTMGVFLPWDLVGF